MREKRVMRLWRMMPRDVMPVPWLGMRPEMTKGLEEVEEARVHSCGYVSLVMFWRVGVFVCCKSVWDVV
jgi:hypothetical protein